MDYFTMFKICLRQNQCVFYKELCCIVAESASPVLDSNPHDTHEVKFKLYYIVIFQLDIKSLNVIQ